MRETPPYSLAEIRLLLSQYIDGGMDAEQMLSIDALLTEFPEYQAEFLKLQAARGLIRDSLERQTGRDMDKETDMDDLTASDVLWQNISRQLEVDRDVPAGAYSPEWISAYVDGEISSDDAERLAFERQLANNPEANQCVADLTQVSEVVKRLGYRLENACTVDVASQVMARFAAEQANASDNFSMDESTPLDADWELLSAFVDDALTPREIIEATRLIESGETARMRLAQLNCLSEQIQMSSRRWQAQAPDLWPVVQRALQADAASGKAAPLSRARQKHWAKRFAVPMAAGILLVLLALPNLNLNTLAPLNGSPDQLPEDSPPALPSAEAQPAFNRELASLPATTTMSVRPVNYVHRPDASDLAPAMADTPMPAKHRKASTLKPMLEPAPVLADSASNSPSQGYHADGISPHKAPSSEAYLFDALSKEMPEEDISNILGK